MTQVVLETGAVLAWLRQEPGAEHVEARLPGALLSSVSFAAVLATIADRGGNVRAASVDLEAYGLVVQPFTAEHAELCAVWHPYAATHSLSLEDRACLALGKTLGATVLTVVPAWATLPLGVSVHVLP